MRIQSKRLWSENDEAAVLDCVRNAGKVGLLMGKKGESPAKTANYANCSALNEIEINYSQYLLLIGEVQRINKYQGTEG